MGIRSSIADFLYPSRLEEIARLEADKRLLVDYIEDQRKIIESRLKKVTELQKALDEAPLPDAVEMARTSQVAFASALRESVRILGGDPAEDELPTTLVTQIAEFAERARKTQVDLTEQLGLGRRSNDQKFEQLLDDHNALRKELAAVQGVHDDLRVRLERSHKCAPTTVELLLAGKQPTRHGGKIVDVDDRRPYKRPRSSKKEKSDAGSRTVSAPIKKKKRR